MTDNRTTERVDLSQRVRDAIYELMREKDMTDNRTTELKPCPFCGGEARIIEEAKNWWKPNCMNRECPSDWTHCYPTREEAIAAWNTRAEQTIAATLGNEHATHGTLTAEQVRKVLLYHLPHREYYSIEQTDAWQVIADELNAELGSGTCEKLPQLTDTVCIVKSGGAEMMFGYWRCSECGCENFEGAKHCMNCGRKVVR